MVLNWPRYGPSSSFGGPVDAAMFKLLAHAAILEPGLHVGRGLAEFAFLSAERLVLLRDCSADLVC